MTRPRPDWTPPMRHGVSASRVAVSAGPETALADLLSARLRAGIDWRERLACGDVLDEQGQALGADARCRAGSVLWYWRSLPPEPRVPFELELLHQDAQIVVVDKPHFLPVTPGGRHLQETVLVRLKRTLGVETLVPVHRLDLETAGVLLFTIDPGVRHAYQALLRERRAHKVYEAVAPWRADLALPLTVSSRLQERPGSAFMQMETVPGEPNALTRVELIERLGVAAARELAHYRLTPLTGRKHQLRAHMNALGLPVAGDRIYPTLWPEPAPDAAPDYTQPLQLLARELSFTDPLSGCTRCFTSRQTLQLVAAGRRPPSSGPGPSEQAF